MTNDFRDMIYLFACGARGISPQINHSLNIEKVIQIANGQNIWSTVFIAAKQLYDQEKLTMDKYIFEQHKNEIMKASIQNTRRNFVIYDTIRFLENNGIKSVVLKGETVSGLYNTPICRVSSDTDILINAEQELKAVRLLRKYGYRVERRPKDMHHVNCFHSRAGILELHISMYSETTDDIFLNNNVKYTENTIEVISPDGFKINALGVTDGLIYLMIHFIKHFINGGAGIRQLMDLLLYMVHYKTSINWERFNKLMLFLKYECLLECLIGIGINYLCFDAEELPDCQPNSNLMKKILSDIEEGGIFGHLAKDRAHFYDAYVQERFYTFKSGDFLAYMKHTKRKDIIISLFPPRTHMLKKYTYVKNSKLMLCAAWLHRLSLMIISVLTGKSQLKQYLSYNVPKTDENKIHERMNLIRDLNMI